MKSCFTKFNYPHDDRTSPGLNLCRKLMVLMVIIGFSMSTASAQSISGLTFFDGNNDGTLGTNELIFPHVTVNVYNASGVLAGSAVSGNDGIYSVSGLTSGTPYRVEFVAPSGYKDASYGTNSSTSVRFVTAPASNIDFGVYVANQCAPGATMPRMVAGCMPYNGDYTSLISFNYNDRWTIPNPGTTAHTGDNHSGNVGVPAGFTVRKSKSQVLFSTLAAENTGLFPTPPDGNSAIYIADYSGGGFTYQSYKLLVKLSNLGIDVTNQYPIAAGVNNIGEFGLGGIAISEDERYIYVVNAGKRNIVRLDISGVTYASIPAGGYTTTAQLPMVEIAIPDATTSCSNGYFRPYALEYRAGKLYVGGICDASSSGSNAGLTAKVFEMDPASNTFTQRFTHDLTTFNVSDLVGTNLPQVKWKHPFAAPAGDGNSGEMQPLFYDIAFDDYGAIIINVLNRRVFTNGSNREAGYVVRTWRQADGSFVLESDRISGPLVSAADIVDQNCQTGNRNNDVAGPGTIGGPKWFFENGLGAYSSAPGLEYTINAHHALANGGVYCLPGTNELVAGFTDPLCTGTAGVRYFNTTNGKTNYGAVFTEAKIFAITGTEGVCAPVPLEIGNRVWNDTDGDGIQDPGENPIANVSLEIFADFDNDDSPDGAALGTATTDANGEWYFNAANVTDGDPGVSGNQAGIQPRKHYMVRVASSDWSAGIGAGDLTGLSLTTSNAGGSGQPDVRDNDASLIGSIPTIAVTTGNAGENDHSLDMGFRVFSCTNPSAITTSQVSPTCNGATTNNNGTISLTGVTNGTHYGVSTRFAASYDGPSFASATAIPGGLPAVIKSGIPNVGGSYIIRVFNGSNTCYTDQAVTIAPVQCTCTPNQITNNSFESGVSSVSTTIGGSDATLAVNGGNGPTGFNPESGVTYWVDASTHGGTGSIDGNYLVWYSTPAAGNPNKCISWYGSPLTFNAGICSSICFKVAAFNPNNLSEGSTALIEFNDPATGWTKSYSAGGVEVTSDPSIYAVKWNLPAPSSPKDINGNPYTGAPGQVINWKSLDWVTVCINMTPPSTQSGISINFSTQGDAFGITGGMALDDLSICTCAAPCTNPSGITTAQVAPTCTGATANNNGTISLTAATNGTHYGVSTLNAGSYDGPAFASATAIPALPAVIKTGVPNSGGTYIVRVYNGDNTCFTDVTVTVSAVTCSPSCTQPSAITTSQVPATCTGMSANNNGTASLVTVTSGTHYGVSTLNAGSYDGPAFASATALPGTLPTVVKTAIPNTGGSYIVRIFNGDNACYTDVTITATTVNCSCAPLPCGTTTVVKN